MSLKSNDELAFPLASSRLWELFVNKTPRVYWFGDGQTEKERTIMMNKVPKNVQTIARMIIMRILGLNSSDKPLIWFMATEDVSNDVLAHGDEEERLHSVVWRLIYYEDEHGILCDFNGWPGDNESGAGYYYEEETGHTVLVFDNSDTSLSTNIAELKDVIKAYEPYRLTLEID